MTKHEHHHRGYTHRIDGNLNIEDSFVPIVVASLASVLEGHDEDPAGHLAHQYRHQMFDKNKRKRLRTKAKVAKKARRK